jgi:23S rRNA (uracil1939-C5)-methyltransferase
VSTSPESCPHRPPCPGCPRFGASELAPAARAGLEALAQRASLPPPVVHRTPALGHRHRARLAVRGSPASPQIGLFEAGTHRVVDIRHCAVHHPRIDETAAALRLAIGETGVAPYAEAAHRGALRYVQVVVERASGRVQVVLVGCGDEPAILGELPEALRARLGDRLQGLFFNAQPARSNAVLGARTVRLAGEPAVCERIGGVDVFFPPTAFGQNHLPLFERAVDRIHALVPKGARVAELYGGVGAIGLGLLARCAEVRFNERSEGGLEGLALGLAARPADERARARIFEGDAGRQHAMLEGAELVLVDPPRKGLDPALRDALAADPPERLVYLACDLASLTRDVDALLAGGRLALGGLEAFDFFPFTEHVETLVWLDRLEGN